MNKLPAGEYVISDPCYVFEEYDYSTLLTETDHFNWRGHGGVFVDPVTTLKFAVFHTKYGDGTYYDNKERVYGVDAGCIACIPKELCVKSYSKYTVVEKFDNDFYVDYVDGMIHFGPLIIDTAPYDTVDDDYYDYIDDNKGYDK